MILEFSVKNFGPIKDEQVLSFQASKDTEYEDIYCVNIKGTRILKLGVIYGPNASGKSTILKAFEFLISLFINPLDQKEALLKYEPFAFDEESSKSSSVLNLQFFINEVKYDYRVEFNRHIILRESLYFYPVGKKAKIFTRQTERDENSYKSKIDYGSRVNPNYKDKLILEGNTISNNTVFGALLKSNVTIPELNNVIRWLIDYAALDLIYPETNLVDQVNKWIEKDEKYKFIIKDLIHNADFQISDFELQERERKLDIDNIGHFVKNFYYLPEEEFEKAMKDRKAMVKDTVFHHKVAVGTKEKYFKLFANQESSGTLRYYGLSGVLALAVLKPAFINIDELESSLHPDIMKQFVLTFLTATTKSQLLFTTHNISFLTNSDMLRNDVIWFTEKMEDGSTDLFSLDDFDSKTFRKKYNSVFNAYNLGKLGAKPKTGSVFLNLDFQSQ